ncbi:MAG TPA: flagellar biosynthesis protein FliQ [Gammaproteobacteria bacterium]|nr:flagellar biosynthesis protein FliQ [Gammaproteobacteria bacterium]
MDSDKALFLVSEMLKAAALVAAPVLAVTLLVGLVISIFQAVTQIQESTLTFVPKLGAVVLTIIVFGAWMLAVLTEFATRMFIDAARLGS